MSLISGLYFRGDLRHKPKQWGPLCDVQRAVRENAERVYGVDYKDIVLCLPFWAPGNQLDYSASVQSCSSVNTGFKNNSILFYDSGYASYTQIPKDVFPGLTNFTIIADFQPITSQVVSVCIIGAWVSNVDMSVLFFTSGSGNIYLRTKSSGSYTDQITNNVYQKGTEEKNWASRREISNGLEYKDLFVSGIKVASYGGSSRPYAVDATSTAKLKINQYASNPDTQQHVQFNNMLVFSSALTDQQIALFHDHPYGLVLPTIFRTYFDLAASSPLSITDTPDLTGILSSPILGSETATGLDYSGYNPVVIASSLSGIDAGAALDIAVLSDATGLGIDAFDQALAFDSPAFANASGVPIECLLGNILYDAAHLSSVFCIITQAQGIAIANDICSVTPISADALINAGYAVAIDASVIGLANGYVLSGGETGVSTDVAVLANASATAIAVMIGNSLLDAAMLAQAGVVILAADETSIANGYGSMITVPSVVLASNEQAAAVEASVLAGATGWVIPGVEVMSVADYAVLVASKGMAVSAFEALVLTDLSAITPVSAWVLTAATNVITHININAIFGTPVLVPVMLGRQVLQNKLQGTPLIIRS